MAKLDSNVGPSPIMCYMINTSRGYPKVFCKVFLFMTHSKILSYLSNLVFCKFRDTLFRSSSNHLSTFCHFVFHVGNGITKKQVTWINADWIITSMQNKVGEWIFSSGYKVRYSMSRILYSSYFDSSIQSYGATSPQPTGFSLI